MLSILLFIAQETERSTAGKIGYTMGYFVGSNFWEVVITAVVLLVAILYFAFYRKSKNNMG